MSLAIPDFSAGFSAADAVAYKQSSQQQNLQIALIAKAMEMAKEQGSQMEQLFASAKALEPAHLGQHFDSRV